MIVAEGHPMIVAKGHRMIVVELLCITMNISMFAVYDMREKTASIHQATSTADRGRANTLSVWNI
jgi:hypothetical protein